MQISVSGKQVSLSESLKNRATGHLSAVVEKYFDKAIDAKVTFSKERSFFTCDIDVHVRHGLSLRGEGEAADVHSAFDDAAEHIAKRLRRYHSRITHHERPAFSPEGTEEGYYYVLKAEQEAKQKGGGSPSFMSVVDKRQVDIATLDIDEAIMRLDLGDQDVMLFRNSANKQINVIYRRADGLICWLDTAKTA